MKRIVKVILTALIIAGLAVPLVSCASESDKVGLPETQVVTVQRGDLTIDITAAGNLSLSRTEDLAFEIAGTVEEVLVEEGDTVKEGQVLARLDTSEWEDYLETLEDQLTTAERNLTTKERALTTAERQVATKELALRQEQVDLQTAEYNLGAITEVQEAQDAVDDAEYDLRIVQMMWEKAAKSEASGGELNYWREEIVVAKASIVEAQRVLAEVLAGSSVSVTTEVALEVATNQLLVEDAQQDVKDAQIAIKDAQVAIEDAQVVIEDAQVAIEDAQVAIDDAQIAVEDIQETLDEALNTNPEITAPFDGFIIGVNVEGGDEVLKGTVAVAIADPTKFEADILVSEMDILQVKVGGEALVQVDAMQGMSLPAEVTHVSPTATIQQGVVNYKVKVELQSLEAVMQEQYQAMQEAIQKIEQGELPERLQQAIEEGRTTQEQVEEMMKQRQQGQEEQQAQVPMMTPENFQLREGLTVIVSIIVDERNNVLLVPNSAITTQVGQTFVQVLAADGTPEQRAVQPGISDYQFTEVTDGLSEGEQVTVPQGTTTAPPTPQQQGPPGGMMIPGMGRPPHD